jgi:hypothetical protein
MPAGVLDRISAMAAHQPQQPVDLAHLGPRQRMLEHGGGVGAHMWAVGGGLAPGELVGKRIAARADAHSVKLYWRGELIKVHPRVAHTRRKVSIRCLAVMRFCPLKMSACPTLAPML